MRLFRKVLFLAMVRAACGQAPSIILVANAEGENPVIAPNTWVEVKGANLSRSADSRKLPISEGSTNAEPIFAKKG